LLANDPSLEKSSNRNPSVCSSVAIRSPTSVEFRKLKQIEKGRLKKVPTNTSHSREQRASSMDRPMLRNVLVSQLTPGKTRHDDHPAFGVSGLLLSDGWILSHGSLLSPNFSEARPHDIRDFLLAVQKEFERDVVAVPQAVTESMRFRMQCKERDGGGESIRSARRIVEKDCSLRVVWRCPLLRRTLNDLLFSWSFEKIAKFDKSVLSIFLLLRVDGSSKSWEDDTTEGRRVLKYVFEFYRKHFGPPASLELTRGASVEIDSAPFGNAVFLDSLSRGIVSNTLGEEDCVILTDANAVPGCEGAPVYLVDDKQALIGRICVSPHRSPGRRHRRICGLVIAPLSWCRGEWVDYTFAANLQACLRKILMRAPDKDYIAGALTSPGASHLLMPDLLDKSVIVVKCGSGWGTGVVVDVPTGTVLTCSHVAPGSRIKVMLGDKQDWARLVYKTRDGQPFDVAVLRLEGKHENLRALPLASEMPERGASVLTAGYPFFSSSPASYSRGVVSRLTPCMIQTTCCVQSGASGGPVICCTSGRMLGLIVSNAVSTASEHAATALYPRFNMAVPATVIRKPILEYVETGGQ
ncbi:hypothetical protein TSAR_011969, partial [Trichomalopsis sarcophagae]